jgi:4-amino-4-deoxy-L-arabinose transferase-like glycosyltransferase
MAGRWRLVALVGVALVPRLIAVAWFGERFHFFDEVIYHDAARDLLGGRGFGLRYDKEPAFPVVLALLGAPSRILLMRLVHAVVIALGTLLIFELGRCTFGERCGIAAALIWALDPLLVASGGLLYAESLAALTLVLAILVALRAARSDRLTLAAAIGLVLGVLTQLRAVGFVLLPVFLLWTAVAPGRSARRRIVHVAVVVAAYGLVLTPWIYRNYAVHGRFVPVARSGDNVAPRMKEEIAAGKRQGSVAPLLRVAYHQPLQLGYRILMEFGHFWELYPTRLATDDTEPLLRLHEMEGRLPTHATVPRSLRDHVSALTFAPELLLAIAGLVVARRRPRETALLVGVILAYSLGYSLFVAKLRYRITILPELFVFCGVALSALAQRLGGSPRRVR